MKNNVRMLALMLVTVLLLTSISVGALADVSSKNYYNDVYDMIDYDSEPIVIDVYSQLANYSGIQTGWGADFFKDRFNVIINIIPDRDGTYDTRMANGNLGDIVVWGSNGDDYKTAVSRGMLLNWESQNYMNFYAPYIAENYTGAIAANKRVSGDDTMHGIGHAVALPVDGAAAHQAFFYTWDLRWDLYKELGYPQIKDLDALLDVFKQMKEICPLDENGNPTYAASLWPDWDGNMVMYVKALATAYYGYDELGIGHYNPANGEFLDCLAEDSVYMKCLEFFHKMNMAGLLDPNSGTQTYDKMSEKVKAGGTFWSIFNYAGSMAYNTDEHMASGRYMYACVPDEATPIVYGMSDVGGNRIWSIGATTEHSEICLAIIDYLATPEGSLTMWYGPKGLMWDYGEDGGAYFTELGNLCNNDRSYSLDGIEWTSEFSGETYVLSGTFNDGFPQMNNVTLVKDMANPDSAIPGETFNHETWNSVLNQNLYPIQKDWQEQTGCISSEQYMEQTSYSLKPSVSYSESAKSTDLAMKWKKVTNNIVTYTWRAMMAKTEGEYKHWVDELIKLGKTADYAECVSWSKGEAAKIWALQNEN